MGNAKSNKEMLFWPVWAVLCLVLVAHIILIFCTSKPIQYYVGMGDQKKVEELLARGVDVNKPLQQNYSLLLVAAMNKRPEIVKMLLKKGAAPNHYSVDQATALHLAIRQNDLATARALLDAGADPNFRCAYYKYTPFDEAVAGRKFEMANLLAEHGGKKSSATD